MRFRYGRGRLVDLLETLEPPRSDLRCMLLVLHRAVLRIGSASVNPGLPVGQVVLEPLLPLLDKALLVVGKVGAVSTLGHIVLRHYRSSRQSLLHRREGELGAGQGLVPVRGSGPVISEMVAVPRLHRDLDLLGEPDRIRQMPSVRNLRVRHVVLVDDCTGKVVGVLLHTPALGEVVFTAGAVERGRPDVVVDENHVIALTPPRLQ